MQATRWQPDIIRQIGRVIGYLRGRGDMAIVRVEQYSDFAHARPDRFHVLKRGAVVALCGSKTGMPQAALRAAVSA